MPFISSLFVGILFLSTVFQSSVFGLPTAEDGKHLDDHDNNQRGPSRKQCETLLERREWRTLNNDEKADYIRAVKCFMERPAQKPAMKEAKTRFDEFQAYHITIANDVHLTGQFLPWHRQMVKSYELALRNECDYKGANPYWDWTKDTDALHASPVFDPQTGFGGDGAVGTYSLPAHGNDSKIFDDTDFKGCVKDGPFSQYTLRFGPGKLVGDHCLTRNIRDSAAVYISSASQRNATDLNDYESFRIELEGEPITPDHKMHDGGHIAIGGEMSNFYSSPGEPLFYLHHANLDRVWWMWQNMRPNRLYEISGRSTTQPPFVNVTLDYSLLMGSIGETVPIRDVMDIHSEPSCYTYID